MLLINKGELNKIVVTLSEKTTINPPYYLFRFVNDVDNTEVSIVLIDTSIYIDRYNEFEFTEGTDITLDNLGFYHYYIYEQDNDTNIDYKLAGALVESGKLKLVNPNEESTTLSIEVEQTYKSFNE